MLSGNFSTKAVELPAINIVAVSNVIRLRDPMKCQTSSGCGTYQAVHRVDLNNCYVSCGRSGAALHVNRTVGVWHEHLASSLPCLARKEISDYPEKCTPPKTCGCMHLPLNPPNLTQRLQTRQTHSPVR